MMTTLTTRQVLLLCAGSALLGFSVGSFLEFTAGLRRRTIAKLSPPQARELAGELLREAQACELANEALAAARREETKP